MRLILFQFAGRQANMEVQRPYLDAILRAHPTAELHLWDLTRNAADARYLQTLDGAHEGRVRVRGDLHPGHPIECMYPNGYPGGTPHRPRGWRPCVCLKHKPPYEKPWKSYAEDDSYADAVFVKIDDDVLFLETDNFPHLVGPLVKHPDRIISANVVNNAVCAKYLRGGEMQDMREKFDLGSPSRPFYDRDWWELHTEAEFASFSHAQFLSSMPFTNMRRSWKPEYVRTRPGEAVSINCVAMTHPTLRRVAGMMGVRLGDEGAVDRCLPWIALSFRAAHLAFGPQEKAMGPALLDQIRGEYTNLRKEYLGA